jgi:hypothetical protein
MKWKSILGSIGARFLGLVLLVAAGAKALEPGAFAEQIRLEQLDFLFSVRTVTLIALALEVGLGTVLILGIRRLWVLFPATLLASFFLFLTGRNYWLVMNGLRDEDAACGCFGSLIERTPGAAFGQDLFLLLVPLSLAYIGREVSHRGFPWRRLLAAGFLVIGVIVYVGGNSDLQFVEMAAEIAGESGEERFVSNDDYLLVLEGSDVPEAEIYHSQESVTFLVLSPQLSAAAVLKVRSGSVETITQEMIFRREDGSIILSSESVFHPEGEFEVDGEGISFTVQGIPLRLRSSSR